MSDERYEKKKSLLGRFVDALLVAIFGKVNRAISWHHLWHWFGLANLLALRVELRRHNLYDTDGDLTQPKNDYSAALIDEELVHPSTLLGKLRGQSDPVSAFLWKQIPLQTQQVLTHPNTTPRQTRAILVLELNKVIRGDPIYSDQLFGGIQLSSQSLNLTGRNPRGDDLAWFNRWLLEDAYTLELRRNRDRKRTCPFHTGPNATRKRTEDGTMNDLAYPAMGCRFSRLGRNMRNLRPVSDDPGLLHPNPLLISQKLLKRDKFIPATSLNLLAGAWIQFQVHDWFGHENEHQKSGKEIRLPKDGDWPPKREDLQEYLDPRADMVIPRTKPDPTNCFPQNARHPAFRNKDPQWWDGSQVYGESVQETLRLRTDPPTNILCPYGKLYLDSTGLLPRNEDGHVLSGFTDNWWLGMEILHTLFAKEHNAICESLRKVERHLTDQEVFETARLVNCAIMAKIHTVEWTPGILAHPAIKPALDANWMGLIGHFLNEGTARAVARWLPNGVIKDVFTGVPLSETDHHGAPYSLTEEFNTVYRLHPLIPDEIAIFKNKMLLRAYQMIEIAFERARQPFDDGASMEDAIYSFGIAHPGAITIQNYPNFLRELKLPVDPDNGRTQPQILDLAAVDIIRDRERGVPRYCEFRRQLRMPAPKDWLELSGDRPKLAGELKEVYGGKIEDVDTMVGMFCEKLPEGFGFSDTAFRIFILMASRRLKSDRFFTSDYTEEFYTKTGLEWITRTGMREVIVRHHPNLESAFISGKNPFAPWRDLGGP